MFLEIIQHETEKSRVFVKSFRRDKMSAKIFEEAYNVCEDKSDSELLAADD